MARRLKELLIILAITFGLGEVVARVVTRSPRMPVILGQPLLPLLPPEPIVRAWIDQRNTAVYLAPDELLGWVPRPSSAGLTYVSNAQGVRAFPTDKVYTSTPAPGRVRIATFGDSFTHCDEVNNDQTWQHHLELGDPRLEVMNYGVPGYGTDQAHLRHEREIARARPHISVLGIWVENICRNLNIFRFYLVPSGGMSAKPRFLLEGGQLELIAGAALSDEEVLQTHLAPSTTTQPLLAKDYWFDPYSVAEYPWRASRAITSVETLYYAWRRAQKRDALYTYRAPEGIDLTVAIARAFATTARAHGSRPVVLIIPMRDFLDTLHAGPGKFPLVGKLEEAGLDVLDMGPPISALAGAQGTESLFLPSGHLTPAGNEAFARELRGLLAPMVEAALTTTTTTSGAETTATATTVR